MSRKRRANRPVYLVDGNRAPFLKARSRQGPFKAADLAVAAGKPLLLRQPFAADAFDEVILGCVMPGPNEANIARIAALRLGCGEATPAWTVQRNCASGLQAVDTAAERIRHGYGDLILAGGVESMSQAPLLFPDDFVNWLGGLNSARDLPDRLRALARFRPHMLKPVIGILCGLTDPVTQMSMGQTAEKLAWQFDISREEMDAFALRSHQRLAAAQQQGNFPHELTPVYDTRGRLWDRDDGVRADTSIEKLARLRPVFDRRYGKVTAGNSAQITDGAAWLVVASAEACERHGLQPVAEILDSEWAALDPSIMGLGPAHAIGHLLARHRMKTGDIDYWEINEAFAAQVIACQRALADDAWCRAHLGHASPGEIPDDRLNVDGGGISIGHPVGASGARILLHLMRVLERERAALGIASLCIGGGQGGAMLIRRYQEATS